LITENITWDGHELLPPIWRREKDSTIAYGPLPIIDDMHVAVNNLLILAEDVVVMWTIDHLDPPNTMEVVAIPEGKRDPRCAIKYKTMPSTTLLQMVGAQI
jgi:hypothetical protein